MGRTKQSIRSENGLVPREHATSAGKAPRSHLGGKNPRALEANKPVHLSRAEHAARADAKKMALVGKSPRFSSAEVAKKAKARAAAAANGDEEEEEEEQAQQNVNRDEEIVVVAQGGVVRRARGAPKAAAGNAGRRKYRTKPGAGALREIRKFQKSTNLLIRKLPFTRTVREVAQDLRPGEEGLRFKPTTLEALQESAETYLTNLMEEAQMAAIHAGRITVKTSDIRFVLMLKAGMGDEIAQDTVAARGYHGGKTTFAAQMAVNKEISAANKIIADAKKAERQAKKAENAAKKAAKLAAAQEAAAAAAEAGDEEEEAVDAIVDMQNDEEEEEAEE